MNLLPNKIADFIRRHELTQWFFEGVTICCAYAPLPGADSNPTTLRRELSKALPSYMLPSRWKSFERLPQNGNGKIDRRALREQFQINLSRPT